MLVAQAVYASCLFQNKQINENIILDIYQEILKEKENIVLIGMPSCGKTKLGKLINAKIGRELIDTDSVIEEVIKMPISEYMALYNEPAFRLVETNVIKEVSKKSGIIIPTGGGAILNPENVNALKQNGKLFFINRSLEKLEATSSRPLSSNKEMLEKRYKERFPIYCKVADKIVDGDLELDEKVNIIIGE